MNEQMYELVSQARNQPVDVVKRAPHGSAILTPVQLEKFAELIVRECVGVAVDNGCGDFVDIEHLLLKHFGVEL
jgi:hypothetical protein